MDRNLLNLEVYVLWLVQYLSVHHCNISDIKDQVQASQGSIKILFSFPRSMQVFHQVGVHIKLFNLIIVL